MRLSVYLILIILMLPIAYAPDDGENANVFIDGIALGDYIYFNDDEDLLLDLRSCSGARFCGADEIVCSAIGDEKCPENYGDWNDCSTNNYGGNCGVCDPDCDLDGDPETNDCGQELQLDVPGSKPRGSINIEVKAYNREVGIEVDGEEVICYKFDIQRQGEHMRYKYDCVCENDICEDNYTTYSPDLACKTNTYGLDLDYYAGGWRDIEGAYVTKDAKTSPNIVPVEGLNDEGNILFSANCNGGDEDVDVKMVVYYLEKSTGDGGYENVNSRSERCFEDGCNIIDLSTARQGDYFVINPNSFNLINGNYKLTAVAIAGKKYEVGAGVFGEIDDDVDEDVNIIGSGYPLNSASVEFDIEGNPAQSNYEGSKVLNIVLARIKSWL